MSRSAALLEHDADGRIAATAPTMIGGRDHVSLPQQADAERIAEFSEQTLGDRSGWTGQVSYPQSLALCVIDAIWSLSSNYDAHVLPVLARYRDLRASADADRDGASDLQAAIQDAGGSDQVAVAMKNHQRTSTRGGVLKAEAVLLAATMLAQHGIETPRSC